jgi:small neutral amino acid transporter SnatA (MarC family)
MDSVGTSPYFSATSGQLPWPVDPLAALGVAARVFVPIFVAMDPFGALPLVFAWTASLDAAERERELRDALLAAFTLGLVFILGMRWLLGVLGVSVPDFLVAGGLVLRALAITDVVVGGGHEGRGSTGSPDFGAVPIGKSRPTYVSACSIALATTAGAPAEWNRPGLPYHSRGHRSRRCTGQRCGW